jgi:hypothetical protein
LSIKAGEKVLPYGAGLLTGTGAENFRRGYQSGLTNEPTFAQNLRGQVPMTDALDNARHNLNVMRENRSNAYKSGMVDVSNDKTVLDFADIDKALNDAKASLSYKGQIIDTNAYQHLTDIENSIKNWKSLDLNEFHAAEGLDKLKQQIGALNQQIPYSQENALRVGECV